jgi:hypothetical protein
MKHNHDVAMKAISELFRMATKPPADVKINNVEYHVNERLEVRVKAPELPAHKVNDDYYEENPY